MLKVFFGRYFILYGLDKFICLLFFPSYLAHVYIYLATSFYIKILAIGMQFWCVFFVILVHVV